MMGQLTTILLVVLSVSMIFILVNVSVRQINPDGPNTYNCEGSLLSSADSNACASGTTFMLNDTNPQNFLPSSSSSISVSTGNIFTDAFTAVKGWLLDATGLSYLLDLLSAPKWMLVSIGVPSEFANVIGAFWWLLVLFLIVGWLLWGDR